MNEKKENKEQTENFNPESKKLSDEILEQGAGGWATDNSHGEHTGLNWNFAGMDE